MKKIAIFLLCIFSLVPFASAKDKVEDMYTYDVEAIKGSASAPGRVVFKVWSYGKVDKLTRDLFKRNAVHALIFKGIPASDDSSTNKGVRALAPDSYDSNRETYDSFFGSGEYLKYVELGNDGNILPGDRRKISNKEYKVGMICIVNKVALRNFLKAKNIIKELGAGY
jgi:hypothetical protein